MSDPRHLLGARVERLVATGLERRGWRVLARNWRVPDGEIDLVCLDPDGVLVAVEVRARRSIRVGSARASVDRRHLARLRAALGRFALAAGVTHGDLRIDLVTVDRTLDGWRAERLPGVDGW